MASKTAEMMNMTKTTGAKGDEVEAAGNAKHLLKNDA